MIDVDLLTQAGLSFGVLGGAVFAGIQSRKANRSATRAADNSHPISNGWGTALRADMARTANGVERISEAQLLAERREMQRDERMERIETALHQHLQDHKTGAVA